MELFELESLFDFGKYKNRKLIDVAIENAMYIEWCIINVKGFKISNESVIEIKKIYPKFLVDEEAIMILKKKQRSYDEHYSNLSSGSHWDGENWESSLDTDQQSEEWGDNYDDCSYGSKWDNENYNDSLDTDQQSPEWWDSL